MTSAQIVPLEIEQLPSQTTTSKDSTPTLPPMSEQEPDIPAQNKRPSARIALAVAVPLLLILFICVIFLLRRHRKRQRARNSGSVCKVFETRYSNMPPVMIVQRAADGEDTISLPRTDSVRHASLTSTQPPSYVSEEGTVLPGYASIAGEADGLAPQYSMEDEKRLLHILQA
ncbi:hypothetical protein BKA62DRAFT_711299 [Auriculariales sp. MPI-PUGE-AT-0066]|nr:hypothetical protein BKA62DRAFT_711299 [Auriculariales sp. MPI-PUGE-AT-0066]